MYTRHTLCTFVFYLQTLFYHGIFISTCAYTNFKRLQLRFLQRCLLTCVSQVIMASKRGAFDVVKTGKNALKAFREKQTAWQAETSVQWKPGDAAVVNQVGARMAAILTMAHLHNAGG